MRLWPVLALAPLLVPLALAQEPMTVAAGKPAGPLEPGGGAAEVAVRVVVPCATLSDAEGPIELSVARLPAWASARLEPARLDPPAGAPCAMAWSGEATLFVSADAAAPALREEAVVVAARLGDAERSVDVPVKAAYKPDILVEANETPKTAKPQTVVEFPVRVTNRGNGATKVSFFVTAPPSFATPQPGSITLQSPLDGPANAATIPVTTITPYHNGRVDEEGVLTVRVVPNYALDPQLTGGAKTLTFRVHAVGTYVPLSGAALATLALALAPALAMRRR